jgi:hypothetical protein
MPVEPILTYGISNDFDPVDETGILVKSVSYSPERDEVMRKGSNRARGYLRYEDPRLGISVSGEMIPDVNGAAQGLANAHPGSSVDLANAADGVDIHGFDIDADNLTVVGNPTRELSDSEAATVTIPATSCPFIAKPAP